MYRQYITKTNANKIQTKQNIRNSPVEFELKRGFDGKNLDRLTLYTI